MAHVPLFGGRFTPPQMRIVQRWARDLDIAAKDDPVAARIARHKGIIIALVKRYADRGEQHGLTVDDLLQIGALTILEDMAEYDASRGEESTFFSVRVYDAIQKATGARRKRGVYMVDFNAPLGHDNDLTLADVLPAHVEDADDISDRLDRAVLLDKLPALLERLSGTNRTIVEMRWLGGMDGEQIAQTLGVTRETVRQHLEEAYQAMHPDTSVVKQEEMPLFPGEHIYHFRPRGAKAPKQTPADAAVTAEQTTLF